MKGQVELIIRDYDLWKWIEEESKKRKQSIEVSIIQILNEKRKEDLFWSNKLK